MTKEKYEVSADRERLDIDEIHRFLSQSYWAHGISRSQVEKSIAGSLCFGLYCGERQVGFARVVTDEVTFGYLADVFVLEPYRNQGLGRLLTRAVVDHPRLRDLRRLLLFTVDAHELYAEFGFQPVEGSNQAMQIYRGADLTALQPAELQAEIEQAERGLVGKRAEILPPSSELVPYKPRSTRMVKVERIKGWKLKLYTIHAGSEQLDSNVLEAAIRFARHNVPWPKDQATPFGFITVHRGEQATWLLVDLWVRDIMHHFVYCSSPMDPMAFQAGPADGTNSCVWEIEVTRHERDAWVRHVLSDPFEPAYNIYLEDSLEILPESLDRKERL
ncbi:MAG: GNAT family N-acetyltransferase [Planctomycetota bacterium]